MARAGAGTGGKLGVIVAEILASNEGLGYLIASSAGNFNTAGVFAALVVFEVEALESAHGSSEDIVDETAGPTTVERATRQGGIVSNCRE